MQRIRIGVLGGGATVEWAILPALLGPDAIAPLDSGAWWSRRPSPTGDIRYQPPADPEVVALCDDPELGLEKDPHLPVSTIKTGFKPSPQLQALSRQVRSAVLYDDLDHMLREANLDVLVASEDCGIEPAELATLVASAPGTAYGIKPPSWLWIEGPPARSITELNAFARAAREGKPSLWMALPLRRAPAHRAARRLLERDSIGPVTALQARFPFALDTARFGAAYAAFDLLLSFVPASQPPRALWAARHGDGATSVLCTLAGGATFSVLFGACDTWNAPWPRLEICGTQGRSVVCESGRRLHHYVPREAVRTWEPPGLAAHVSGPNTSGYGEDIKAFLGVCADNPAPWNAERALADAARALGVLEAAFSSLERNAPVEIAPRGLVPALENEAELPLEITAITAPSRNLTLDLV